MSVVDITNVRMVASLVEKDFRRVSVGIDAEVATDAFPGETFKGKVSRVAPVFDTATRTASMEIEVPNPGFRLKPGMYARVGVIIEQHKDAIVVPTNAVVDANGTRGVYVNVNGTAQFRPVKTGIENSRSTSSFTFPSLRTRPTLGTCLSWSSISDALFSSSR